MYSYYANWQKNDKEKCLFLLLFARYFVPLSNIIDNHFNNDLPHTMKKILFLFFAVLLPLFAAAQDDDFTADRPGTTNSADILPLGRLQWETAVGWERSKLDGPSTTTWTLNSSTLRYGIGGRAEIHLQADRLLSSCDGEHDGGFANVAVGTKVRLYTPETDGPLLPAVCLLGNVFVPGGSDAAFLPRYWGGQVGLVFQHELAPWCTLNYDGELTWSDDERPQAFLGICLGFTLSDRLSLVAEEYNYNQSGGSESWIGLGLGWQIAPRLQLDLGTDLSLNHFGDYHNLTVGLVWQLTKFSH